jgi:hypothetical protein
MILGVPVSKSGKNMNFKKTKFSEILILKAIKEHENGREAKEIWQ